MKLLFPLFLSLLSLSFTAPAADLTVTGGASQIFNAKDLRNGAGSNLRGNADLTGGLTVLTVSNVPATWKVRAHLAAGAPGGVSVFVKRASAGAGPGYIAGGEAYTELTGAETELFSGFGPRSNVSLQFKLTGLSVGTSPATYLSAIVYTVQ